MIKATAFTLYSTSDRPAPLFAGKVLLLDGTKVTTGGFGTHHRVHTLEFTDLRTMGKWMQETQRFRPDSMNTIKHGAGATFLVRGAPVSTEGFLPRTHNGQGATLAPDAPTWVMLDLDAKLESARLSSTAQKARATWEMMDEKERGEWVRDHVLPHLPELIRGQSPDFIWNLSSSCFLSHGHWRGHVFFALDRAVSDAEWKHLMDDGSVWDSALYTPSQPHFFAAPNFCESRERCGTKKDGTPIYRGIGHEDDPLAGMRWGFSEGLARELHVPHFEIPPVKVYEVDTEPLGPSATKNTQKGIGVWMAIHDEMMQLAAKHREGINDAKAMPSMIRRLEIAIDNGDLTHSMFLIFKNMCMDPNLWGPGTWDEHDFQKKCGFMLGKLASIR